jgi:hypothetical protein
MHHQHVCEGAGIHSLKSRRYLHSALSVFVYSLPRTYQNVSAPENTVIAFEVTGEAADTWFLIREGEVWQLYAASDSSPDARVSMSDDSAWRMFTKGISREALQADSQISGDNALAQPLLKSIAILA